MRTFAFPFVVFAEQGFVLFYLRFDFAEGFFAARAQMLVAGGGMQRTGGKSQIQR